MADIEPGESAAEPAGRSNLALRVASSLVLAPLALIVAWLGGWSFNLFWTVASFVVLCEWVLLVRRAPAPASWLWMIGGAVYAGAMLVATLKLRADPAFGLAAIVYLFAVVWMTDIAAYFAGRAFGGPKLMPRVSPKKTWSGAIGGTAAGVIAAVIVAKFFGLGNLAAIVAVALVLSIVSQAGDLLESALKRQFGAKDSSGLLPGHGGLMDRLDGFAVAVIAAALIGAARGGIDAPARGLMAW